MWYANVGVIKSLHVHKCIYVCGVCVRVSLEEFTEIGKNSCFCRWQGLEVRDEKGPFFLLHDSYIF